MKLQDDTLRFILPRAEKSTYIFNSGELLTEYMEFYGKFAGRKDWKVNVPQGVKPSEELTIANVKFANVDLGISWANRIEGAYRQEEEKELLDSCKSKLQKCHVVINIQLRFA